jgi:hypothetical protein
VHAPARQVSVCVQASPSSHAVPSGWSTFEQTPVFGSQVPPESHALAGGHTIGLLPVHAPAVHASLCVHASPSSHAVPSGASGFEQSPVVESHVPATWHASSALHVTGAPLWHAPAMHMSACVHASPSSHTAPSGFSGFEHMPVVSSQVPAVWH